MYLRVAMVVVVYLPSKPTLVTPWTVACQAPLLMDFPGKNTAMSCIFLLQGNLPNSGIEPSFPVLQADSLPTEPPGKPIFEC